MRGRFQGLGRRDEGGKGALELLAAAVGLVAREGTQAVDDLAGGEAEELEEAGGAVADLAAEDEVEELATGEAAEGAGKRGKR